MGNPLEDGDAVDASAAHNLIPALPSLSATWTPVASHSRGDIESGKQSIEDSGQRYSDVRQVGCLPSTGVNAYLCCVLCCLQSLRTYHTPRRFHSWLECHVGTFCNNLWQLEQAVQPNCFSDGSCRHKASLRIPRVQRVYTSIHGAP